MSNKERGEVTIKAADKTYTIRFTNKHLCGLEDDLGVGIQEILQIFNNLPTMNQSRIIFRRGLMENHGDIELDEVSDIIDDVDYMELVNKLLEGIAGAFPTLTTSKKKTNRSRGNGPNPSKRPSVRA